MSKCEKSCGKQSSLMPVIVTSIITALLTTLIITNVQTKSEEELMADFYFAETAVAVSPHHIRKDISKGKDEIILVDLRSQEEYEEEHIIGAINIPAYKDKDHSDYGAVDRIVASFAELLPTDKDIIVYCYSTPCMTGRKVGAILAEKEIYVKHLNIGWNDWRYDWEAWNHPHEWDITNVEDYVVSGSEPGEFTAINLDDLLDSPCSLEENELGC